MAILKSVDVIKGSSECANVSGIYHISEDIIYITIKKHLLMQGFNKRLIAFSSSSQLLLQ